MIVVVEAYNAHEHAALLDAMFRLRARIFRDKLGWDVSVVDGRERDRFDDEAPVYLIHTDARGRVDASCRLLPTTGPTLLGETFADTLPDAAFISSPSVWECTRFCVDYGASADDARHVAKAASAIIAEIGTIALKAGVDTVLGNFDAMMLRVYRRIGCDVEILGCTHRFGRPVYLGGFPVLQSTIDAIRDRLEPPPALQASPAAA